MQYFPKVPLGVIHKNPVNKNILLLLCLMLLAITSILAQSEPIQSASAIKSHVDSSQSGELFLIQEVQIQAPVEAVWDAYTTEEGWKNWSSPLVDMDMRIHGTIQSNYNTAGRIGDSSTNTLQIINYVPYRILTLQADISKNWPEFMKEDAERLYNVNVFEATSDSTSRLVSYGIGYKNTAAYRKLMDFFIQGNEWSYRKLLAYLEEGKAATW